MSECEPTEEMVAAGSTVTEVPEAEIDSDRLALEQAFYDWWSENEFALANGYSGDVFSLRDRLNAATAKRLRS